MQYTANYNLNVPEGTDIVNPLVQDNPNWAAIDGAMYANKLRVIGTATEVTTGSAHALTRADTDIPAFRFVATSDYNTGDTFTVDGVTVTARLANGTTMPNGAYKINSTVVAILDGTLLNFINIDGIKPATAVSYDDSSSGITASTVQQAVDILAHSDTITAATSDNGTVSLKVTIRGKIAFIGATVTLSDRTAATTITIPGLDMVYTEFWVTNYQGWTPSDQVETPAAFSGNRIILQANQSFPYIKIGVAVPLN